MIINKINSDLFAHFETGQYDALLHCANCFHIMGGGIARVISSKYPAAYKADKSTPYGSRMKLGTYSKASTQYGDIINLYGQYDIGIDKIRVEYNAIKIGMRLINRDYAGKKICLPKIGSSLAGGDWNIINKIINESTPNVELTLIWL